MLVRLPGMQLFSIMLVSYEHIFMLRALNSAYLSQWHASVDMCCTELLAEHVEKLLTTALQVEDLKRFMPQILHIVQPGSKPAATASKNVGSAGSLVDIFSFTK